MKIQTRPRRPQYKNVLQTKKRCESFEVWSSQAKLGQNWRHTSKQTRQFSSDFNERNFVVNPKIRPFAMNFLIGGILPKRFPFSFFFFGLKCKKQLVDSCPPTRKCRVHTKHKQHRKLEDLRIHTWALRPTYAWTGGLGEMSNRLMGVGMKILDLNSSIFFTKP